MCSERIGNEETLENDSDSSHCKANSAAELATIAAILNGEQHRFHDLVRPYLRGAYVIALRFLKNEADAEDATQEALLKAFCYLRRFRGESRFSTWLYAILLNESRAKLRRTATMRLESLDVTPWDVGYVDLWLADTADDPAQALDRNETRTLLNRAIETLPQIYREVFQLREEKCLSVRETADLLAITAETVKVRLHRARALLRKRLKPSIHLNQPSKVWSVSGPRR